MKIVLIKHPISEEHLKEVAALAFEFMENTSNHEYNSTEHYSTLTFMNYRLSECSILFHHEIGDFRLTKGIGGVNCNHLKLYSKLLELGYLKIQK